MAVVRLPHHVELRRRATGAREDGYRNERLGEPERIRCRGRVDAISSDEEVTNRDTSRTNYNVILRPTGDDARKTAADLAGYDELFWEEEGLTLKLDGDAVPLHDGLGRRHHFEALAYKVRP